MEKLTVLLKAAAGGDTSARERVVSLIYEELHARARALLYRERQGHTMSSRDLVHEVYLRLFESDKLEWKDRNHFYSIAVRRMRQILINYAKRRKVRLQFLEQIRDSLRTRAPLVDDPRHEAESLSNALDRLDAGGPRAKRLVQVLEMKYFGGLRHGEIAEIMGLSPKTVQRDVEAGLMVLLKALSRHGDAS